MSHLHLELKDRQDLEQAMGYVSWLSRPVVKQVSLDFSMLGKDREQELEKRLTRLFNDCGCLWGAPGFFLGSGLSYLAYLEGAGFSWSAVGISALIGTASATGAKLLGLLWSFCQLQRTLSQLKARLTQA